MSRDEEHHQISNHLLLPQHRWSKVGKKVENLCLFQVYACVLKYVTLIE